MKKFFIIAVALLIGVSIATSLHAGDDIIKPPNNSCELIGKVIGFTNNADKKNNVWNLLIMGTSEHVVGGMYRKDIIIYVSNANYFGYEIKQITYHSNPHSDWWQVEFYIPAGYLKRESRHWGHIREKSESIHILSIQ